MTEDEMVGWHHQLDAHEFEQAPGELNIRFFANPWTVARQAPLSMERSRQE